MPFVGCILPTLDTLHVANTETTKISIFPSSIVPGSGLESLLEQFVDSNGRLELLVVVDTSNDDTDVSSVCTMARRFAKQVRLIPSLMARITAVLSELRQTWRIAFYRCTTFAIVTCAVGMECVLLHRSIRGDSRFKVVEDFYRGPGAAFDPDLFMDRPSNIAAVTFDVPGVPDDIRITDKVPLERVRFADLDAMLLCGGIAKALQIVGDATVPCVVDFVDAMVAHCGTTAVKTFERTPIPTVFEFEAPEAGPIHIKSAPRIALTSPLRCPSRVLLTLTDIPEHTPIKIEVDEFGTITCANQTHSTHSEPLLPLSSPAKAASPESRPQKFVPVVGHVFLSGNYVISSPDGTFKHETVPNLAEVTSGTPLTLDTIYEHCSAVFAHFPSTVPTPRTFVLSHDGTLPAAWIKAAVDMANLYLHPRTNVHVISDMMAYVHYALLCRRTLNDPTPDHVFLALVQGSQCRIIYIDFDATEGWKIRDTSKVTFTTTDDVSVMFEGALQKTYDSSTRLLVTDVATVSLQKAAASLDIHILRVESFEKARAEGLLSFGSVVADPDVCASRRVADFEPVVHFIPNMGDKRELFGGRSVAVGKPFAFWSDVEVGSSLERFEITQQLSTFSPFDYVLFSSKTLPKPLTSFRITFRKACFDAPVIQFDPPITDSEYALPFPHFEIIQPARGRLASSRSSSVTPSSSSSSTNLSPRPKPVPLASLFRSSSTAPSRKSRRSRQALATPSPPIVLTTARINPKLGTTQLREMLRNHVEFVVIFDVNTSSVQVRLVMPHGFEILPIEDGQDWFPFYVSFAYGTPRFGFDAMADQVKYRNRVVWDVLHVLGRDVREVVVQRNWEFGIVPCSRRVSTAMITVESYLGHLILDPARVTALFLTEIQALIRRATGRNMRTVFFKLPLAPKNVVSALKDACRLAYLDCAGSNTLSSK